MKERAALDPTVDAIALRKLTFLASRPDGANRLLFRLSLTKRDTSFYLVPYGPGNTYHFGVERFGHSERTKTFTYTGQFDGPNMPKLSLHRSGWVRTATGDSEAARLLAAPFHVVSGQHVATLRIDGLNELPAHSGPIRSVGSRRDLVTDVPGSVDHVRVVIRINSTSDRFESEEAYSGGSPWVVPVFRGNERLWIGVFIVDNTEMSAEGSVSCTTAIAGWDVREPKDAELLFAYIVAR
jgi:hypothetical protein